jgi:hypothetical protein
MTIKWTIEKVKTTGDTNVVTHVYWLCEDVEDVKNVGDVKDIKNNNKTGCAGVCELVLGDTFTAYDQLTEQQVLGWVFDPKVTELKDANGNIVETVTQDIKAQAELEVASLLAIKIAQEQSEPILPWAA